jgi:hypothetical protein
VSRAICSPCRPPALLPLAAAVCLFVASTAVRAQLLDDIEMRREGADATVQVRFIVPVRYVRSVTSRSGELTQAYYEVLERTGAQGVPQLPAERRFAGGGGLPTLTISDEPVGGSSTERKLVIRTSPPSRLRMRAGRDNRSIDVVLEGLGTQVRPAVPVAALPQSQPGQRLVVVLQSSTDPSLQLTAPVPAALQDYQVGTAQRVVDGVTLYELTLASQVEASRALDLLRKRFPKASVLALPGAPAAAATPAPATAAADTPSVAAPVAAAVDPELAGPASLAQARQAEARGDLPAAIDALNRVLDLPPNRVSREAQEMIGVVRLRAGETTRARREFELFLKLYPTGADSKRVAARLAALPVPASTDVARAERPPVAATTTINGSTGLYYYGGKSQIRSEEFRDSSIGGLPELVQNPTISGVDQKLAIANVDLNYRHRDAEQDLRFVFRDSYQANMLAGKPDRNKLSALYVDHRSFKTGTSVRLGRQSPLGGGILGRFDGLQAGYAFAPKWKVNVVGGMPADKLQQTRRYFYGTSVDADAITEHVGGSLYAIEQKIDGVTDRRALGTDLRYFNGGTFVSSSFDYDTVLRAVNVASVQGTWQQIDAAGAAGTSVNFMLDRRAQPLLMLGNALFFQDPNGGPIPVRLSDALALRSLETLRDSVRTTTAFSNQALLGVTTPLNPRWQIGADVRLSNIGAIAPVPDILPNGQPATGNIWSLGGQLIGSNLYSARDTHVFNTSYQTAPTFKGLLLSYNNLSALNEAWQLEPSLQYYRQSGTDGLDLVRWKPGLRVSWRVAQSWVLETSLDYEVTHITSPTRNENSNRAFYYLGGRYDF